MTTDENPADAVTEQVAFVRERAEELIRVALSEGKDSPEKLADLLITAGLLADPADRDEREFVNVVNEGIRQKRRALAAIKERDELNEQVMAYQAPGGEYEKGYEHGSLLAAKFKAERDEAVREARAHAWKVLGWSKQNRARAERAEAERDELRQKWLTFTGALGFGDNKTERAAELAEMVHPIECAFAAERDHYECAVICELCGDPLASKTCDECHGSGCLPNSALAYLECGTCAGVGKIHEGCVEKSYTDLAAERDELRATVERARALADEWAGFGTHTWFRQIHVTAAESLHAALDGAGEQQ